MATAQVKLPPKLVSVFEGPARYRGAYGGRGSAKTRNFALMTAVRAHMFAQANIRGVILCAREFMNSLDESSMAEVKTAIQETPWLKPFFDIGEKYIKTICGRVSYVFAGLRSNLDSLKSKARILIAWVDEAESVSEVAWSKLVPTVRADGSEIWVTWNPESSHSATHKRFRVDPPDNAKIVEMNWRDNPWFPSVLNDERLSDQKKRPETYEHVWEGGFNDTPQGAYFTRHIADMRREGRLGRVAADPLLQKIAFFDIGGTGRRADARAIWVAQMVGQEIRVLDYQESQSQELAFDVRWLQEHHSDLKRCVLPHDGVQGDKVFAVSTQSALQSAGYMVDVVPNQGAGAAMIRVETVRRIFPRVWMSTKCEDAGGLGRLAAYREKLDERLNIGLGPLHDDASHGADAFGSMAVYAEQNGTLQNTAANAMSKLMSGSSVGWMGS
jgi:phage terminase large subunit